MFSAIIKRRGERKDKRYDASITRYDIEEIYPYIYISLIFIIICFFSFRDIYIVIKK